jgi:uncharacterized DUF497 family protein
MERGLDFADAGQVFAGEVRTAVDDRRDYGEDRYITPDISMVGWSKWSGPRVDKRGTSFR